VLYAPWAPSEAEPDALRAWRAAGRPMTADGAVRLGLIGVGSWGLKLLAAMTACPGTAPARVASTNPATAARVPPGCVVVPDWRALAAARDLDGVVVAVPPSAIPGSPPPSSRPACRFSWKSRWP